MTILGENGVPTPVVHSRMLAPSSRMGPADDVDGAAKASPLFAKYGERVDRESARELLAARMEKAAPPDAPATKPVPAPAARKGPAPAQHETPLEQVGDFLGSRQGQQLQKQVMRGVFGMLRKKF